MSIWKKLFGGGAKLEPEVEKSPASVPRPQLDLSKADQPVDCSGIDWNEAEQFRFLDEELKEKGQCEAFQNLINSAPFSGNKSLSLTDAAVLYAMASQYRPGRIMEVGGGYSTLVLRTAKDAEDLPGELITIDPDPEIDIVELIDAHIATPIQQVPVDDFEILMSGEMVVLNTSHIDVPESDVDYLFSKILPALTSGVLVGVQGIRLPKNYTKEELEQGYNEQDRVLELLKKGGKVKVLYAGAWLEDEGKVGKGDESVFLWFEVL
jgi:hypothetical protein